MVSALASNAKHIPFRNSRLTHMLQHALSGLRPRRVRFVLREQPYSCGNPATGQFAKWADCARLVQQAVGDGPADAATCGDSG